LDAEGLARAFGVEDVESTIIQTITELSIKVPDGLFPLIRVDEPRKGVQREVSRLMRKVTEQRVKSFYENQATLQAEGANKSRALFLSAIDGTAGAWRHASTKLEENLLSDQAIRDACNKQIGLDLDLPPQCAACGTTINRLVEEHGISCAASKGGSGRAGGHLERAVTQALRQLSTDISLKPVIENIPGLEKADIRKDAKTFGDILVETGGLTYVIDVAFSTDPSKRTVEHKETVKYKEYSVNRRTPGKVRLMVVPMAVDVMGKWGPRMKAFFESLVGRKIALTPQFKGDITRNYRYAKEKISIAVIKAYGAYMKIMRYGWKKRGTQGTGGKLQAARQEDDDDSSVESASSHSSSGSEEE
jgi:hypothetical protein